jgi:F-type H+-transporting ATPase subunit epsilon
MKLRVFTPTEVVLEGDVAHVTAEDPTGSLGIRPGHAPLVTPIVRSILTARDTEGGEQYVAVDGGVMLVDGDSVEVATRQAVASNDMRELEDTVLVRFEQEADADRTNRTALEKMRISFMRRVLDMDRAGERL